ncbi:MAG: RAMP superfamily CRISPR-associated protein, partial [Abditibacteriales bacterium]|nr:RAMP superfamily CRISPR-associated protein [Abditibacteriales bacterium]MDW8366248.1 RAMP superfamily CRISPR-associated protein [Abditibacteriales bacterium]
GVLRAHCERLARTVDSDERRQRHNGKPLACDPLNERNACGRRLEGKEWSSARKHNESCFLCQLFGNTSLASHFRIEDGYPKNPDAVRQEERNGVAIDRVFGSVAVGPFNYETVTAGEFQTSLHLKNFTLAQLGLLSLALRDLSAERVRIGFAKSRGLGVVTGKVTELTLRYPLCELDGEQLRFLGGKALDKSKLYGVGAFVAENEGYGYPSSDEVALPPNYGYIADEWLGVEVRAPSRDDAGADWQPLGRACVAQWKAVVEDGR